MADGNSEARDARGRFGPGNSFARGNSRHRRVAQLRAAMLDAVTPEDVRAVLVALVAKAKRGDVAATRVLLDRLFGKVGDSDLGEAGDLSELGAFVIRGGPGVTEAFRSAGIG